MGEDGAPGGWLFGDVVCRRFFLLFCRFFLWFCFGGAVFVSFFKSFFGGEVVVFVVIDDFFKKEERKERERFMVNTKTTDKEIDQHPARQ